MKKIGFTLAEVLIVLSLLGVVAALTIPTLYTNKTKQEYSAKIKRFYSKVDNALEENRLQRGISFDDMKRPAIITNEDNTEDRYTNGYEWWMENVDPYMGHKYLKTKNGRTNIYFDDGSSITGFYLGSCLDVYYDVNGDKSPNRNGVDKYVFLVCFTPQLREKLLGSKNNIWGAYGTNLRSSSSARTDILEKCKKGVYKTDSDGNPEIDENGKLILTTQPGIYCSALLQYDNWEFKPDYPNL